MAEVNGCGKRSDEAGTQAHPRSRFTLLIVSVKLPPETFIWRLVQEAVASGIHVQVVVSVKAGQKLPGVQGVQFIKSPSWNDSVRQRFREFLPLLAWKAFRHPKALSRLMRLLIRNDERMSLREQVVSLFRFLPFVGLKPDVLHFQWNATAVESLLLFDYLKCPVVVSCRGSQINIAPHNPRRTQLLQGLGRTFAKASAVHCVSESVEREAIRYGLNRSKSRVIRPAVDPNFYSTKKRASGPQAGPVRLLTAGSLLWVKGYEYALLAVRGLLDSGVPVEFEIIGGGPERQRLLYTIHDLGLQSHVRLRGQLSPEEVRQSLLHSDVFLLSSLSEGISNAALEAMSCGLPVVTTDCGGMREAVRDGVEGFVVPVRDVDAMVEALRRLALDDQLRESLGAAARRRVLERFNLKEQGLQFLSLYTSLVQAADAPGELIING